MFTGIIESLGKIIAIQKNGNRFVLTIQSHFKNLKLGESIAVEGVCLTLVQQKKGQFQVELGQETLRKTTLKNLKIDSMVNLERALRLKDRLGGHYVQGHIDGVGKILSIHPEKNSKIFTFSYPKSMGAYLIPKGSIAIDGISLTIVKVTSEIFTSSILSYTEKNTSLKNKKVGDFVNLEADLFAKIVEKQLKY
jgi:riboflavin synthase